MNPWNHLRNSAVIKRRQFLHGLGSGLLLSVMPAVASEPGGLHGSALREAIAACERESGGRLGIAVFDTGTRQRFEWRAGERFPMCSTFKFLLVAAILRRVDEGKDRLDRRIIIAGSDLVSHSPVTETLLGPDGASLAQLCEATMTMSDNAAANLLLPATGGPAGLTRFARSLGDRRTRLDRNETSLNSAIPGDPRDTTTPRAMLDNLERLLLGPTLTATSRGILTAWLIDNRTGDARLRAGLPKDWRVGDKTGSGMNGTTNDIAIVWPPARAPILISSYITGSPLDSAGRDHIQAKIARLLAAAPG